MHLSPGRALMAASARLLTRGLCGHGGLAASVLIATRNRATYLDLTLAALERQSFPRDAWEVVVADAGSQDETGDVLDRYQQRRRLRIERLTLPAGVRANALNEALHAAQGRIVVLLEDDRLIAPDFLLRHLPPHLTEPCVVLGDSHRHVHTHLLAAGEPVLTGVSPAPMLTVADLEFPERLDGLVFDDSREDRPLFARWAREGVPNPFPWIDFTGGNASAPREDLLRVGGWDAGFSGWGLGAWGLEDQELALRLHRAGLPFHYEPRAVALRQFHPSAPPSRAERVRGLCYFVTRHPELNRGQMERLLLGDGAPRQ